MRALKCRPADMRSVPKYCEISCNLGPAVASRIYDIMWAICFRLGNDEQCIGNFVVCTMHITRRIMMIWCGMVFNIFTSHMCFSLIDGLAFDLYADFPRALLQANAGPPPIFQLQHFPPHKHLSDGMLLPEALLIILPYHVDEYAWISQLIWIKVFN